MTFLNGRSICLTCKDLIKYFGFELGAQANAKPADDRWIINGAHDAGKLQDYLDGFIQKFVLCKKCKNPETDIVIKDDRILLDCKACGQRSEVDIRLKLSGFILKNEPKKGGGKKDKKEKKSRRDRNREKEASENGDVNGSPGDSNSEGDRDADEQATSRNDELAREAATIQANGDHEVSWTVDTSEEAVKARAKDLPDDLKRALVINGDDAEDGENDANSPYEELGTWIIASAEKSPNGVSGVSDIDIYKKAKELEIESKHRTLTVLAQTIFDKNIVKQISARAPLLKTVCQVRPVITFFNH